MRGVVPLPPDALQRDSSYDRGEAGQLEPQMLPFTKEQLVGADWEPHPKNPLITPPPNTAYFLADPTWLPSSHTPDGRYHLIAPVGPGLREFTLRPKLVEFTSDDGINWNTTGKALVTGAARPFLYHEGDRYYLFYSRVTRFIPGTSALHSHIEMISSTDFQTWTEPTRIFGPSKDVPRQKKAVGNPSVIKSGDRYLMYLSAGTSYLTDCFFTEPDAIWVAEAEAIEGPYNLLSKDPIIAPRDDDPHMNVGAGSIKVYTSRDGFFVGFQNTISKDRKRWAKSSSAIKVVWSEDGIHWEGHESEHKVKPDPTKGQLFAYACDVRWDSRSEELRLYYNTRRGRSLGVEEISLAVAKFLPNDNS